MYVEQDCTIEHEGKTFEAGGSVVTPEYVIGYVRGIEERFFDHFTYRSVEVYGNVEITDWHGNKLGTGKVIAHWPIPNGVYSPRMYQVTAVINGRVYKGRSLGNDMLWRGKFSGMAK